MPVLIGTSGWQYRDWKPLLYPDVPQRCWLERHAEALATVEVNNAFYRLPDRTVFAGWAARTPADYVITIKASRFLSNIKRLREPAEPVARLMDRCSGLGDKLGPVLQQVPPTLQRDVQLLDDCLGCFPAGTRVGVEPRHDSWWDPSVRAVLPRRCGACPRSNVDVRAAPAQMRTFSSGKWQATKWFGLISSSFGMTSAHTSCAL